MYILCVVILTMGITNCKIVKNFSLTSAAVINDMALALEDIQVSLNSLIRVVMEGDFFLAWQCLICTVFNISCYIWVNVLGQVKESIQ